MARDYVTVANLATGFIGDDDLISAPDEQSKPARTVAAVWDEVRRFVLSKNDWTFARRRLELAARPATAEDPVIGFDNAFPLPVDCRRLCEILEPLDCVDAYALGANVEGKGEILADTIGPLKIRYIADVVDPALWSDGFTEAFAMRLAWQICDRLSGDKARKTDANRAFELALRRAGGVNAKQDPPRSLGRGDWVRARRSSMPDPTSGFH